MTRATAADIHELAASMPGAEPPHFDGHLSVLLWHSRVGELSREELAGVVYDAWLARAPKRLARQWLADHHLEGTV